VIASKPAIRDAIRLGGGGNSESLFAFMLSIYFTIGIK
jgi:hypothetical protein